MQILVDYLGFSSGKISLEQFETLFNFNFLVFQERKSALGYINHRWYPGINIYYNHQFDWHIEFSGSGCRVLERIISDFTWEDLFVYLRPFILNKLIHVSRLDIACDDLENIVSFSKMYQHLRQNKYITRATYCHWTEGSEQSIYVGSPKSDKRLRIYNKAIEQKVDFSWIRFEFQLRNDEALQFILNLYYHNYNFSYLFLGFLNQTIRFTRDVVDKENSHCSRSVIADWWLKFCKGIKKLNYLRLLGKEYDVDSLIRYIRQSCGSSILTYMKLTDGDVGGLFDLLKDVQLNNNQKRLISENLNRSDK